MRRVTRSGGLVDDGTLREAHWFDAEAEIGASDGAKKGSAKDFAVFANDGGALLIGARENKPGQTFAIAPIRSSVNGGRPATRPCRLTWPVIRR